MVQNGTLEPEPLLEDEPSLHKPVQTVTDPVILRAILRFQGSLFRGLHGFDRDFKGAAYRAVDKGFVGFVMGSLG